jgi:ribose 5-phosphate isomerase B
MIFKSKIPNGLKKFGILSLRFGVCPTSGIFLDTKTGEMLISCFTTTGKGGFSMKLAIGCDHGGWELKEEILKFLKKIANIEVIDYGPPGKDSVDYPDYGRKVSEAVSRGSVDRGILICGTGIGMSIVANRYPSVRAALCHDHFTAQMSRLHNDANILVMGERVIGKGVACELTRTWLETGFEGGRHQQRLDKIQAIEQSLKG